MHTINLDTLNEDRLIQSVDSETFNLGADLYDQGRVDVVELSELAALCTVLDKRQYRVTFKVANQHLYLKCTCSHASRGLICEHDVAAWLAIRSKLIEQIPPKWLTRMDQLVAQTPERRFRSAASPYFLFFSLQPDLGIGSQDYKIAPLILPASAVPKEVLQSDTGEIAWNSVFTAFPEVPLRARTPYQLLDPEGCLNRSREAANIANLILERKRNPHPAKEFPLAEFLPLLRTIEKKIFVGNSHHPFQKEIELLDKPVEISLEINRTDEAILVRPQLSLQDRLIDLELDQLEIIHRQPFWILTPRECFEMIDQPTLELLFEFEQKPEISIPLSDIQAFADQFLLPLSQRVNITGNAVAWEQVVSQPVKRLYLVESNGELLLQLKFCYDGYEVTYDPALPQKSITQKPASLTLVEIIRDSAQELAAHDLLGSAAFGMKRAPLPAKSGFFRLRARTHPVDFLLNILPRLSEEGFEIYGEERLKTARVNRNTPSITFRVSSGIDWFDVQAVVSFGELEVPLKEIRRLFRKQERFVKLSDGSIGEIPEEWLERYRHLFALGEIREERLRFSKHHISLIDQALIEADRIEQDAEFSRRREKLRQLSNADFKGITPQALPEGFLGELRPYQKAGFDWLHFLHEHGFGGCLADDMGLGKTIQALVFLQSLYQPNNPPPPDLPASLLIVPRSLLVNWQREAARFTPGLKILEYFETNREKDLHNFDRCNLVITTYGVMLRDIQFLHGYEFYYAILDESQSIKNPLSQTARAAQLLRSQNRLVLTGTPIENTTAELWSQFAFLNPGLLGNLKTFKNEFGLPIEKKQDERAAEKLRKIVFPFILRRTKDQVAPELPPRTEKILYCDMEPAQRKLYNRTRDAYRGMLLGMIENQSLNESRMKILEGLLRLRQICNHPQLVDEHFHGASAKFDLLIDTLETLRAEKHKALVFSQFVKMLSLVRKAVEDRKIPYAYLDGQTQARQEQVDRFQEDSRIPLFLISLKAGGLGLNLTAADYVIHIDPWWNPAVEMQASNRTHRIGQEKPVFVFKLIARDSVEEKILLLQENKRNLVDKIITTESAFFKSLNADDVQILFS